MIAEMKLNPVQRITKNPVMGIPQKSPYSRILGEHSYSAGTLIRSKAQGLRNRYQRLKACDDISGLAGELHQKLVEREQRDLAHRRYVLSNALEDAEFRLQHLTMQQEKAAAAGEEAAAADEIQKARYARRSHRKSIAGRGFDSPRLHHLKPSIFRGFLFW